MSDHREPLPDMNTVRRSLADIKAGRCQPIQEVIEELSIKAHREGHSRLLKDVITARRESLRRTRAD